MSILISSVKGNMQKLDGGAMFGNVPKVMWSNWIKANDENTIDLDCRGMLLRIAGRIILCEVGIGAFFEPKLAKRFGVTSSGNILFQSLAELNVKEEDVDGIILSHLHFDHAGGLLTDFEDGANQLRFPNAQIYVGQRAWERANQPHFRDRASFLPVLNNLLKDSGRLNLVEGKNHPDLPKEISFYYSDGHTPGQMHTVLAGKKSKLVFCGDLIPGSTWIHLPVTMGYDRFPEQLIDEKKQLYSELKHDQDILFFTHDTKCVASTFVLDEKGKYRAGKTFDKLIDHEL